MGQKCSAFFIFILKISLFGCTGSELWHMGSSVFTVACRSFLSWDGIWDLVP